MEVPELPQPGFAAALKKGTLNPPVGQLSGNRRLHAYALTSRPAGGGSITCFAHRRADWTRRPDAAVQVLYLFVYFAVVFPFSKNSSVTSPLDVMVRSTKPFSTVGGLAVFAV